MKLPRIFFSLLLVSFAGLISVNAQPLADPSVNGATVNPAPNMNLGTPAFVSFSFLNSSSTDIPLVGNNHINITLSNLSVNGAFTAVNITGPGSIYFTWTYNAALLTLTGTQNQLIPGFAGGQIIFNNLKVIGTSLPASPQNGLNVNVVFLGAFNASTSNDNSSAFTFTSSAIPTAVTMLDFNGRIKNCGVNLSWSTAQEFNSKDFVVQNSTDGNTWNSIGTVAAKGTSNTVTNYNFVHPNPVPGTNLYRLLEEDRDGRSAFSATVNERIQCSNPVITINPNPFVDNVNIYLTSSKDEQVTVKLYDNMGRELQSKSVAVLQGSTVIKLDNVSTLPRGVYLVKVTTPEAMATQKLVK